MAEDATVVRGQYDEAMVRKAVRTFVWRRFVLEERVLWALAGAMLLLCGWLIAQGDRSWLAILTGVVGLIPLLFVLVGWFVHLKASLGRLRAMPVPEAEFAFDEQGFRATSGLGDMRLPWSSVAEAWVRQDFWMFIIAPNQFVTLPTQNVPARTLDQLRDWLGGNVVDL